MTERKDAFVLHHSRLMDLLFIVMLTALIITSLTGLLGFSLGSVHEVTNRFGETILVFGSGIYRYDSLFKASVFTGTDLAFILIVAPALLVGYGIWKRRRSGSAYLMVFSLSCTVLYYAVSLSFGVSQNELLIVYAVLLGASFLLTLLMMRELDAGGVLMTPGRTLPHGLIVFLVISGIALFVAWLPDILVSLAAGRPIELIEVYTTEVTYPIDMGIISPLLLLTAFLLKRGDRSFALIMLAALLTLCIVIGPVLMFQTVFQTLAGVVVPVPQLITKVMVFVVLAGFAARYQIGLMRSVEVGLR